MDSPSCRAYPGPCIPGSLHPGVADWATLAHVTGGLDLSQSQDRAAEMLELVMDCRIRAIQGSGIPDPLREAIPGITMIGDFTPREQYVSRPDL